MGEPELKKSRVSMMASKHQGMSSKSLGAMGIMNKSMSRMKMRRPSFGFKGIPGIGKAMERTSQVAIEFKRPQLLYLNTYQLDPHPHMVFHVAQITKMADALLDELWANHKYNSADSPALALRIAGDLMRNTKAFGYNRYRIISVVTIGQKRSQSYNNAIAFLWDHERDKYVDLQRECTTAFIQATIFGVYLD